MVDLPQVPRRLFLTPAATNNLTAADIKGPYQSLSQGLSEAGAAIEDIAVPLAEKAGLQSVSIAADGTPQVDRPPLPMFGKIGLAFEKAVKIAALAKGETESEKGLIDLREKFKTDPSSFEIAANEYRDQKVAQWSSAAGPLVGVNLEKTISNTANGMYRGLRNENERRALLDSADSIRARADDAESKAAMLVRSGGDTNSEELQGYIATAQTLRLELARNPLITYSEDRARLDNEKLTADLSVARKAYLITGPGGVYEREGYDAAVKAAQSVRNDIAIKAAAPYREAAYHKLTADINARRRQDDLGTRQYSGQFDAIEKLAADGIVPTEQQLDPLRNEVERTGNPMVAERLRQTDAVVQFARDAREMPPAELQRSLASIDKNPALTDSPELVAQKAVGERLLKTMRKQVAVDPLGWADRVGYQAVPPIDFAAPDATVQMRNRIAVAETVAQHYGGPQVYLRPDEAGALEAIAAKGGQPMTDMARAIVVGFGDRAPRVLAQVSRNAPVLAHIGALVESNGSPGFVQDAAEAIHLRSDPAFVVPKWLDKPSEKILSQQMSEARSVYGGAFIAAPDTGSIAGQTARTAFFARAVRQGFDPLLATSDSKSAFDKSLQEAAGARFTSDGTQLGGIGTYKPGYWTAFKVLVPSDVRADGFRDVIQSIRDDDLKALPTPPQTADGKPYRARDLQNAVPVAVRGGYRFAVGDPSSDDPRYIRGADGQPFVLDFDSISPTLRARVPGAFAGGR